MYNKTVFFFLFFFGSAPPIVANFNPTSCTLSSVTVQWTAISAVGPVDGYVLTAARAQQINGSVSTYIVGPKTNSYTFSSLVPGAWYNITAQGVICSKTQYGIKSEVTVTVSGEPLWLCNCIDIYHLWQLQR